ncbi:MAG: TetR/AcrR family transcriptional regulator [Anaerolineaceae bacterium]
MSYRASIQSEIRELTHKRILDAVWDLSLDFWLDEITLSQIADRANVSVQTLFRHFDSRDVLIEKSLENFIQTIRDLRSDTLDVSVQSIVDTLLNSYEQNGNWFFRLQSQENRFPGRAKWNRAWQEIQLEWVQRNFSVYLQALSPINQQELEQILVGMTDVHFWKVYRHDLGKSLEETRQIWIRVLRAVLLSYR